MSATDFTIPVIETKRLILRGPEPEDYPDFKSTFTSYRARFMGGPLNAYEAWMLYAAEIGHWQIRGFGMWMIHDKKTDETYGMAGGWKPAKWPEAEIAWVIWPEAVGQGLHWKRRTRRAGISTGTAGTARSAISIPRIWTASVWPNGWVL